MSDPALVFQGALVTLLKSNGGVGTANRVYDAVPSDPTFPYVRVGDDQVIGDDDDCEELSQIFARIHVWSRATGFPEAKGIVSQIRTRLRNASLNLSGFQVDIIKFVQTQYLEDPDGISRHAVIEAEFLISHI